METVFNKLSNINLETDDIAELSNDIERALYISKLLLFKKAILDKNVDTDTIYELLKWLTLNISEEYEDIFVATLSEFSKRLIYKTHAESKQLYEIYETLTTKVATKNKEQVILAYICFLANYTNITKICEILENPCGQITNMLSLLYNDFTKMINLEDPEEALNITNRNIIRAYNTDINVNNATELLNFLSYYPFIFYLDCNTRLYISHMAKILRKVVPELTYVADHCITRVYNTKKRIGYISYYLDKYHSIFRTFHGNVMYNHGDDTEVYLFIFNKPDNTAVHNFINKCQNVVYLNDPLDLFSIREQIASYNLDVLVYPEIGEHKLINYLSFSRLAPVQVASIGHCDTSGIDTIDYYISSRLYEPENGEDYYSEKLIRLYGLVTYYIPEIPTKELDCISLYPSKPHKARHELGFRNDDIIISCIQHELKMSIPFIKTLDKILKISPRIKILLKKPTLDIGEVTEGHKYRFEKYMNKGRFEKQTIMIEWQQIHEYHDLMNIADIVLIPFPFGGLCTAMDAFQHDKPVVTLDGQKLCGRFTAGFYRYMGIDECVATNESKYFKIVERLCNDIEFYESIVDKIRVHKHILYCNEESAKEWVNCLKSLVSN